MALWRCFSLDSFSFVLFSHMRSQNTVSDSLHPQFAQYAWTCIRICRWTHQPTAIATTSKGLPLFRCSSSRRLFLVAHSFLLLVKFMRPRVLGRVIPVQMWLELCVYCCKTHTNAPHIIFVICYMVVWNAQKCTNPTCNRSVCFDQCSREFASFRFVLKTSN